MKLTIAGDIHGSAKYCGLLLNAHDREKSDRLILLGDLLYHGPRNGLCEEYDPKAVSKMLNERADEILAIRGNCDSEVDQMVLDFPMMSEWLLLENSGISAIALHGHKNMDFLPLKGIKAVLSGHTHVPTNIMRNGVLWANPGSATIPKENSPRGYMIWENDRFLWKTLAGEVYDGFNMQIIDNNPNR